MIDPTLHRYLNDSDKDRLAKLESLFNSDGYSLLVEWAQSNYEAAKRNVLAAQSWPENRVATGAMLAYGELLRVQDRTIQEFEAMAEATKEVLAQQAEDAELDYE